MPDDTRALDAALVAWVQDKEKVAGFLAHARDYVAASRPDHPAVLVGECPHCDTVMWMALLADRDAQLAAAELQGRVAEASAAGAIQTVRELEQIRSSEAAQQEAAERQLAAVRTLRDEHIHNGIAVDGCYSGDCPHETDADCKAHLAEAYAELMTSLDAILGAPPPVVPGDRLTEQQAAQVLLARDAYRRAKRQGVTGWFMVVVEDLLAILDAHCLRVAPETSELTLEAVTDPRPVAPADRLSTLRNVVACWRQNAEALPTVSSPAILACASELESALDWLAARCGHGADCIECEADAISGPRVAPEGETP